MLEILLYAFPTMVLLLGAYLLLYREPLKNFLQIDSSKLIIIFSISFFVLAILGFLITLARLLTWVYIWIIFIVIYTAFMVFVFYKIYDTNSKKNDK